jgi:hypothetical protein
MYEVLVVEMDEAEDDLPTNGCLPLRSQFTENSASDRSI